MIAVIMLLLEDSFLIRQLPPARTVGIFSGREDSTSFGQHTHPRRITLKRKDRSSFKGRNGICTNNSDVHAEAILGTIRYSHYSKLESHSQHLELLLIT